MTTASVTEFKANVSTYLRRVEEGEEIVITNHGRVSARVVPEVPNKKDGREFLIRAAALRKQLARSRDERTAKDYIARGRR